MPLRLGLGHQRPHELHGRGVKGVGHLVACGQAEGAFAGTRGGVQGQGVSVCVRFTGQRQNVRCQRGRASAPICSAGRPGSAQGRQRGMRPGRGVEEYSRLGRAEPTLRCGRAMRPAGAARPSTANYPPTLPIPCARAPQGRPVRPITHPPTRSPTHPPTHPPVTGSLRRSRPPEGAIHSSLPPSFSATCSVSWYSTTNGPNGGWERARGELTGLGRGPGGSPHTSVPPCHRGRHPAVLRRLAVQGAPSPA